MTATNQNYFPTQYQEFIHLSRYARWIEELGRRETWEETVDRYMEYMFDEKCEGKIDAGTRGEVREGILSLEALPSMRCVMSAGKALKRDECAGYNCSYLAVDHPRAFDESLYILMCGTGVGFSVERQFVDRLPAVADRLRASKTKITVEDSKIGWANAFAELISMLYLGRVPEYDTSKVRPEGAKLKTFGGRSSGPQPLIDLFEFTISTFKGAEGRKLNSLECHDLMCKIGEIVVVGGVRRCLPEGALVQTVRGLVPIESVEVGDEIVTGGKVAKVTAQVESGEQQTIMIKHENGCVEVTGGHRMAVFVSKDGKPEIEFKKASDLTLEDVLVWDTAGTDGIKTELPEVVPSSHFNANDVITPELDTDIAWLIGVVHGDGCVNVRSVSITSATSEIAILERAKDIFCRFGIVGSISEGNGECLRLRVNSKPLSEWFGRYVKQSHASISIPDFIMNGTRSIRCSYLAGLFDADGRCREDGRLDQLTTIYMDFGKYVVSMLSSLGIGVYHSKHSAIKRREAGVNAHDFSTVSIRGNTNRERWVSDIGCFSVSGKCPNSIDATSPYDFRYPVNLLGNPAGWSKNSSVTHRTAVKKGFVSDESPLLPTPIREMSVSDFVPTYDIEVEGISQFTTSGVVVHNSALISLSNLSDDRMRKAKSGEWWNSFPHRSLANNSACYTEKPEAERFLREWIALMESKSGERGIFNREAAQKVVARNGRRDPNHEFGTNPCSEIILRSCGFCNLSEVVARSDDDIDSLERKIRLAVILGTVQSTLTEFRYLRPIWRENAEEECLLGVSITGIMDHTLLSGKEGKKKLAAILDRLREYAISVNKEWSKKLGVNQAVAVTCVKPSGTISQLVDSASGIHARFAPYYIRTVRADKKDPLAAMMMDIGFPYEDEVNKPDSVAVFKFPVKAPADSVFTNDMTAIEQLEIWRVYQRHWTEHKPSVTVYVKDKEWVEVGAWVYKHFDEISGVSFLPHTGHTYKQAPYQEISEEQYLTLLSEMPEGVDWSMLQVYETEDTTVGQKTLACGAGGCEQVDLTASTEG